MAIINYRMVTLILEKMKNYICISIFILAGLVSCKNQDWEFPNYDYQTVYFAHQFPVRTVTFGEDIFDTSLDNQKKIQIMATIGGVYSAFQDVEIDIEVDNSLTEDLLFGAGQNEIKYMPTNYYQLASNRITIPKGGLIGGVEVQLNDAFFEDPLAISNNYVIPLKITRVVNADSILNGIPAIDNPNPSIADDWEIMPKNFTLYAVKYINEWTGMYLRRGKDEIQGVNGNEHLNQTVIRRQPDVEKDQVQRILTRNMRTALLPLTYQGNNNVNQSSDVVLTFDDNQNCTITAASINYTASGTGKFVKLGEKNSWGQRDRNALYLEYTINHPEMTINVTDTLVVRDREVGMELFVPALKP